MKAQILTAYLGRFLVCLTVATPVMRAQQVLATPPASLVPAPASPYTANKVKSLADIASGFKNSGPLAQWGPIAVRPHFLYRLMYSDGLLNPSQRESDTSTIHSVTTGLFFELGQHWSLDYSLSKSFYSNQIIEDTLDHNASLNGWVSHGDWTLSLTQTYATNSPILVETAQQTRQKSYATTVSGSYHLGMRTLLNSSVTRSSRLANTRNNSPQWTDADWFSWAISNGLQYQISPRVSAGVGVDITFDRVSEGSNMTSTQPHVQMSWRPTDKISLSGQIGAETRRIDNESAGDLKNPIYSASIQYHPFEVTSIALAASQGVTASYFANQASKSSSLSLSFSQRLLEKFYFSAGASKGKTIYIATARGFASGRNDEYTSYNARISTVVVTRGSIAVFFQTSRNSSNTAEFGFSSHQIGTEIGYRF